MASDEKQRSRQRPSMDFNGIPWNRLLHGYRIGIGGGGRNRTGVYGFAIRCITILLPRHAENYRAQKNLRESNLLSQEFGAGNETRTRDLYLGKVSLYQLSYSRKKRSSHYMDIASGVKEIGVKPSWQ